MDRKMFSSGDVEARMITVRGQMGLLDRDVAELYGVLTKHVNQAVRNNPDKFPEGYVVTLNDDEMQQVKFFDLSKRTHYNAKLFTEKGLYMLATILKSPVATDASIKIIEAYSKIKELGRAASKAMVETSTERKKSMLNRVGELFSDLASENMEVSEDELSVELNLIAVKITRTVRRQKPRKNQK
ncbi:MAG: ORF6N domain-containing protein [Treponema sp.]|nr:ORF6N domain-containing protein [Treponema sp.]